MRRFPGTVNQSAAEAAEPTTSNQSPVPVSDTTTESAEDSVVDVLDPDYEDEEAYVEGDSIYYSTGDVAQRLGISRDMTRSHIKAFEEFLHITYTRPEGRYKHMRLLSTDIELLEKIVRLRKNGHSVDSVKQILQDPDLAGAMHGPTVDISSALSDLLARNNTALLAEVKKIMDANTAQNKLLLESSGEKDRKIDELTTEIDELKELLLKQTLEMHHQSETVDALRTMISEQAASKKKGFWNRFR